MKLEGHLKGAVLTGIGILLLSPDALLIRLMQADTWTILFWRGLVFGIIMMLISMFLEKSIEPRQLFNLGRAEIQLIAVNASMHFFFVFAIQETVVANTLVIMSISPLLGAILSVLLLKERVADRTWLTTIAVFFGLLLIFSQSMGGGTLLGDTSALAVALLLACNFVLLRRYRHVNMIPAVAWGMILSAGLAWPLATPTAIGATDWFYVLLFGMVILAIGYVLITLGPRYLPAPEVGLIMLLEVILGPLWVWLIIYETPSFQTLMGGAMILLALSWMSIITILETQKKKTGVSK
jgi:drug/metabolite transporter (DMT)-like permease